MTDKEILSEIRICKSKFKQLSKEVMSSADDPMAIRKLVEMKNIAGRISELEELRDKRLTDETKTKALKAITTLKSLIKKYL